MTLHAAVCPAPTPVAARPPTSDRAITAAAAANGSIPRARNVPTSPASTLPVPLTTPKTAKSRRRIRLTAGSIAALKAHRRRLSALWRDHGLVFPSTVGTPPCHRNLIRTFKNLLRRAGLPESTRLYDLRHTCATLLLTRNVHPKYVQELLCHASTTFTLDTYSHVLPGMDGGAASAIDEALG